MTGGPFSPKTWQDVQHRLSPPGCPHVAFGYASTRISAESSGNLRSVARRVCSRALAIPAISTSTVPIIRPVRDNRPDKRPASRASALPKGRSSWPEVNSLTFAASSRGRPEGATPSQSSKRAGVGRYTISPRASIWRAFATASGFSSHKSRTKLVSKIIPHRGSGDRLPFERLERP